MSRALAVVLDDPRVVPLLGGLRVPLGVRPADPVLLRAERLLDAPTGSAAASALPPASPPDAPLYRLLGKRSHTVKPL